MKSLVIASIMAAISTSCFAQETTETTPKPLVLRKNEIGLMAETNFSPNMYAGNIDFRGLQYKRWVKPNKGFRIIAAYGEYFENNKPIIQGKFGDTVVQMSRQTTIPNGILGVGLDMQRKFFKSVVLFAAVEVRATYGKGHYNYITSEYVENNPNNNYSAAKGTPDRAVTLFSVAATPTIGAKLEFKRLGFGTELSAVQLGYTKVDYEGTPSKKDNINTGDFNMGLFRQRFFVYYRF